MPLKHVQISAGLLFVSPELTLLTQIGTYALVFVSSFTVSFSSSPFTTLDTAIIRSIRQVVFCKKGVLTDFSKFHKKTAALKTCFWLSCRSTEFNFIKKEIPAQMFSCEF